MHPAPASIAGRLRLLASWLTSAATTSPLTPWCRHAPHRPVVEEEKVDGKEHERTEMREQRDKDRSAALTTTA